VEILWKTGGSLVEVPSVEKKIGPQLQQSHARVVWTRASRVPSLDRPRSLLKNAAVLPTPLRFQETIGGRVYQIEVSPVGANRWRAQIVRAPGVPTAMMPFYGPTPTEAARQLSAWLALAHRTAAGTAAVPSS
jgi:hypothetical protein